MQHLIKTRIYKCLGNSFFFFCNPSDPSEWEVLERSLGKTIIDGQRVKWMYS